MSYIASGGSQMPSFSPVFLNPPKHSFAALPLAFGPLALKLHWQILADIGRYFQNLSANWQTFFFFYMQPCRSPFRDILDLLKVIVLLRTFAKHGPGVIL